MGYDGPMTHRQFLCWREWINWHLPNIVSRDNYYIMQLTAEVRRNVSKHPNKIKTEDFKITVKRKGDVEVKSPEEVQKKVDFIKQAWLARMTAKVSIRQDGQEVDTYIPFVVKQRELKKKQAEQRNQLRAQNTKANKNLANPPNKDSNSGSINNIGRDSSKDNGGRILLPRNARRGRGKDKS